MAPVQRLEQRQRAARPPLLQPGLGHGERGPQPRRLPPGRQRLQQLQRAVRVAPAQPGDRRPVALRGPARLARRAPRPVLAEAFARRRLQRLHAGADVAEGLAVADELPRIAPRAVGGLGAPLRRERVRAEVLEVVRDAAVAGPLQHLEEVRHAVRVDAAARQVAGGHPVRLALVGAGVVELALHLGGLRQVRRRQQRRQLVQAGQQHAGAGQQPGLRVRHLVVQPRDVALGDVRQLVRHHPGQLALAPRPHDQPGVEGQHAARHGEGVDRRILDDQEIELLLDAVGGEHPPAQVPQVGVRLRVLAHRHPPVQLRPQQLAQARLLGRGHGAVGRLADAGQVRVVDDRRVRARRRGQQDAARQRQPPPRAGPAASRAHAH